jgi:hypothetical protein
MTLAAVSSSYVAWQSSVSATKHHDHQRFEASPIRQVSRSHQMANRAQPL